MRPDHLNLAKHLYLAQGYNISDVDHLPRLRAETLTSQTNKPPFVLRNHAAIHAAIHTPCVISFIPVSGENMREIVENTPINQIIEALKPLQL